MAATREKESMVMKFAVREKDILISQKKAEEADRKMKAAVKEREEATNKMKTAVADKVKFQAVADSRLQDVCNLRKEVTINEFWFWTSLFCLLKVQLTWKKFSNFCPKFLNSADQNSCVKSELLILESILSQLKQEFFKLPTAEFKNGEFQFLTEGHQMKARKIDFAQITDGPIEFKSGKLFRDLCKSY